MNANQLLADGLDEQCSNDGAVHTAGQCQQDLLITDLLGDECFCQSRGSDTFHSFGTDIACHIDASITIRV